MNYDEYINLLSEKKERINYMHQVIKKIIEDNTVTTLQLDVLIRGYIILIYSLWESAYKDLSVHFFYELSETEIDKLPFKLKDKILCFYIDKIKKKELKVYTCLEYANTKINNLKATKVNDCKNIETFFAEVSNNPDFKILLKLLSLYSFKVDSSDEIKQQIQFIINSRNDIAHSGQIIDNYNDFTISYFGDSKSAIDILQEITMNIFLLYKEVVDKFKDKFK